MSRTRSLAGAALVVTAAVVLAACSGSSDAGTSDGAVRTEATTSTTEPVVNAAPVGEQANGPAVPSKGCGLGLQEPVTKAKEYLDDSDRWYLITTPDDLDADTPLPLVLDFHGLAEGADVHALMTELPEYGQDQGFLVVSPNGTGTPVKWAVDPDTEANLDLRYTQDLLDQLEAEQCIDLSRVYATGLSNGGFMSSILGCTMADRFAAIAPVAGLIRPEACDPSRPVPVLAFHGTADPILLFNGGVGDRLGNVLPGGDAEPQAGGEAALPEADLDGDGYPQAAQDWATGNGCSGDPQDDDLSDTVIERTWDCPADAPVEFLIIEGGGHTWPGSEFSNKLAHIMGPTDMDTDANQLIWQFFQRFQLP
ncbi:alpha/beta hydrolase family esterase [Aquihabitans daechungensis]|uniref:alpha/beta hydrolase family esterase n=1 Tax=Aquihabitans daechungensis TaxID=1052257 RepID=UPI003BA1C357